MDDVFQERYLDHQKRKNNSLEDFKGSDKTSYSELARDILTNVLSSRRSQRIFNDDVVSSEDMEWILKAIRVAPSSCNRQAVYVVDADPSVADNLLVGGKGWASKAQKILLLFADRLAYKSPNEKGFMPYLDAGFAAENAYLMCEVMGLGCCFVNPNIREENKQAFTREFGEDYFCGALVIGHYDVKANKPPLRDVGEVMRCKKIK